MLLLIRWQKVKDENKLWKAKQLPNHTGNKRELKKTASKMKPKGVAPKKKIAELKK